MAVAAAAFEFAIYSKVFLLLGNHRRVTDAEFEAISLSIDCPWQHLTASSWHDNDSGAEVEWKAKTLRRSLASHRAEKAQQGADSHEPLDATRLSNTVRNDLELQTSSADVTQKHRRTARLQQHIAMFEAVDCKMQGYNAWPGTRLCARESQRAEIEIPKKDQNRKGMSTSSFTRVWKDASVVQKLGYHSGKLEADERERKLRI
ncbi:hypothetical protein FISHEDRAFT_56605 [Fistulina hepatica ATCC 64428]|uniref:Uncharacterized protein n=1 Tax=Fistulina hepatica ATCC 64428 TaxID=1128425 RepID=A0A0D7AHV2_9AGAR|nr:hypothetical protein FISHEDRAFT_56605 [Fistulina hepatica ATCC 64428]